MKEKIVKCKICEKDLKVYFKQHLSNPYSPEYRNPKSLTYGKTKRTFQYWDSSEGVLFENRNWFCNNCWKEIITPIKLKT